MWETKVFKTKEAMSNWINAHGHKNQWNYLYVNNAYGVEYRKLRVI